MIKFRLYGNEQNKFSARTNRNHTIYYKNELVFFKSGIQINKRIFKRKL